MPQLTTLTPTAILVLLILLVIAFLVGTYIDKKRLQAKLDKYPRARKMQKIDPEVEKLLEFDENSYS